MAYEKKDIDDHKTLAAVGYLFILFLVPLLGAKESPYAQMHARQGLALALFGVGVMIINTVIGWVPLIGWLIAIVLSVTYIAGVVMGIMKALNGEEWEVPFIGQYFKNVKF